MGLNIDKRIMSKILFQFLLVFSFSQIAYNVFVYGLLRGLASNLANKNRIENP
jgi:general stress protein CsbA